MVQNQRQPLATPATVIEDHGGEAAFYLAWVHGDLDAEVQNWFREQAVHDPSLRADLRSLEQRDGRGYSTQAAQEQVALALEASNYLPPPETEEAGTPMTDLADPAKTAGSTEPLREMVRPAAPQLLEELGIQFPPGQEAALYGQLLNHLVGGEAVRRFRRLQKEFAWIHDKASGPNPTALYRALGVLVLELCDASSPARLSYRLFLRTRLKHFCRQSGWQPADRTLNAACEGLTRQRIGRIVEEALQTQEYEELSEGLQLAYADGEA